MGYLATAMIAPGDGTLRLDEISIPDPGPGEAVVRVRACGLCHSDLGSLEQRFSDGTPGLLGHEAAVSVEAVGEGVVGLSPGDYGIVAWRAPCGKCRMCRRGEPAMCTDSRRAAQSMHASDGRELSAMLAIGAFSERTLIHAEQVVVVDRAVPPEVAGLIGCGVMTGFGAAAYTGNVRIGDTVAVFGCGGVGDAAIAAASLAGASKVIAIDLNPVKLEWSARFGATDFVNASEVDAVAAVRSLTDGVGADVAIECVGSPQVVVQAFEASAPTGAVVQVGVPRGDVAISLPIRSLFQHRGPIRASHYGDCVPTRDFPALCSLYLQGKLDLGAFVTETIKLEELPAAVERLERGEVLRSVVVFD